MIRRYPHHTLYRTRTPTAPTTPTPGPACAVTPPTARGRGRQPAPRTYVLTGGAKSARGRGRACRALVRLPLRYVFRPAPDGARTSFYAAAVPDLPGRERQTGGLSLQSAVGGHDDLQAAVVLLRVPVEHPVHDVGHRHARAGVARDQ